MRGKAGDRTRAAGLPDGGRAGASPSVGKRTLVETELTEEVPRGATARVEAIGRDGSGESRIQRKDDPAAAIPGAGGAVGPAGVAGASPPAGVLVDDDIEAGPQQMRREEFLAKVEPAIKAAVSAELGPLWNVADCPYIEKYLAAYRGRPAAVVEQFARPRTRWSARSAASCPGS